jgi:hypothetical protein
MVRLGINKAFAKREIFEPALLRDHAVRRGIELGHGGFPAGVL